MDLKQLYAKLLSGIANYGDDAIRLTPYADGIVRSDILTNTLAMPMSAYDDLTDTIKSAAKSTDNVVNLSQLDSGLYGGHRVGNLGNVLNRKPSYDLTTKIVIPGLDGDDISDLSKGFPAYRSTFDIGDDTTSVLADGMFQYTPVKKHPIYSQNKSYGNLFGHSKRPVNHEIQSNGSLADFMKKHYPNNYWTLEDDLPF